MNFDLKIHLVDLLRQALVRVAPDHVDTPVSLERPKQASHGDFSCNVAMQLARSARRNPRELATQLVEALPVSPWVEKAEVAGAGFVNLFVTPAARLAIVSQVLTAGPRFGESSMGCGRKVQVEYVSANPTGPLHVGHGRGAAYGASVASLLAFAGHEVAREYYVNDAGRQMDILAISTWLRYLDSYGVRVPFPRNAYQGDYVRTMAAAIREAHGDRYFAALPPAAAAAVLEGVPAAGDDPEGHLDMLIANGKRLLGEEWAYVHQFALTEQLGDCRDDLSEFGVHFDQWFSERSLFDTGLVARCVAELEKRGHVYVQDGARWFRSTDFGDEKDRVVQRDNGIYTYFASDIAYHANKVERGFDRVIDIWGADHHGYIARVRGAMKALGLDDEVLHVALVQFAVLYRDGQKTSMSTRSGEFVTLRELRAEVGNDAARFFYVLRKSDQHLDFDLDLAKKQSNDNPVYYIQYAHARVCSVIAQWGGDEAGLRTLGKEMLARLDGTHELAVASRLAEFPDVIEAAARDLAPHMIAFYLKDLAADFHSWYNAERFLVDDEVLAQARLAMALAVRQVLHNGLTLLGVSSPQSM